MSHEHAERSKHTASTTNGSHPNEAPRGTRLTPPHAPHNFGEQLVESHTSGQIHAPFNLYSAPAIATFTAEGDGFQIVSTRMLTLPSVSTSSDLANVDANSPTVVFSPSRTGEHRGRLTINVAWGDGQVEHQVVELRGRARTLEQPPTHETTPDELAAEKQAEKLRADEGAKDVKARQVEAKRRDPVANNIAVKFDGVEGIAGRAKTAAKRLAQAQSRGCGVVAAENASYVQKLPKQEHSVWWDLAEMALNAGTAGLAGHIAKNLLPKIKRAFETDEMREVAKGAVEKFSEFTTDAIKDGLKQAGRRAIAAGMSSSPESREAPQTGELGYGHSTNKRIDFFTEQQKILDDQAINNEDLIADQGAHLRPLLRHEPAHALNVMEAFRDEFTASAQFAEANQAEETSARWANFVARMKLGTSHVEAVPGPHATEATAMEAVRPGKPDVSPKSIAGVIDVFISSEHPPLKVERAVLNGISQATADRLARVPLATQLLPMRFVVKEGGFEPSIITRDEAGRVRVSGSLAGSNEADAVERATKLVEQVLHKPLSSWGVQLQTDDATGHGEK
ncbi:MAG: hypothetical protein JWO36_1742 [Myxococcales bacterium]|nr:hypothetical protein [Myxococcales bacterium]